MNQALFSKHFRRLWTLVHARPVPFLIGTTAATVLALMISLQDHGGSQVIFKQFGALDFSNASILGNPAQTILNGEERQYSKNQRNISDAQTQLKTEVETLKSELATIKASKLPDTDVSPTPTLGSLTGGTPYGPIPSGTPLPRPGSGGSSDTLPEDFGSTRIDTPSTDHIGISRSAPRRPGMGPSSSSLISFPVKSTGNSYLKKPSVVLPSGSYVKAKLLTGIEAPEGKTYPVLLQLDFAYVIPNDKRLDLAGCFIIAKAQGDLSTERVQMQATKLSCVSKRGGMFEREINGFVSDDKDNSFAVIGSVNSKQDRVAAMAFLSSIVAGVGKAIQQAQTTQQATPLGGSQSVITGDQAKYMAAGGASEAATLVTQWYLKQAQSLLPTINVGSGQDVWVVMQDQVELPKDYFSQNSSGGIANDSIYSNFTRLID